MRGAGETGGAGGERGEGRGQPGVMGGGGSQLFCLFVFL